MPFIEYPHGSKRHSSISMQGRILSIPDNCEMESLLWLVICICLSLSLAYLCRFLPVLGVVLPKDFHDFRVELGHEDLDGLVGLGVDLPGKVAVQRVEGVEVPAVTVKVSTLPPRFFYKSLLSYRFREPMQ